MTPLDLKAARQRLRLTAAGLGRALELEGKDPGRSIRLWEAGRPIPGPARVAIRFMLAAASRSLQEAPGPLLATPVAATPPKASPAPPPAAAFSRRRGQAA